MGCAWGFWRSWWAPEVTAAMGARHASLRLQPLQQHAMMLRRQQQCQWETTLGSLQSWEGKCRCLLLLALVLVLVLVLGAGWRQPQGGTVTSHQTCHWLLLLLVLAQVLAPV